MLIRIFEKKKPVFADGYEQLLAKGGVEMQFEEANKAYLLNNLYEGAKKYKLTLASHPGKALVMIKHKDEYAGHDVNYFKIGDAQNAMEVLAMKKQGEEGEFLRFANRPDHCFDCREGKYH